MGQPSWAFGTGLVSRGTSTTVIWLAHWLRRAEARRPGGRLGGAQTGTVLSFLLVMCNSRPFGLRVNASRCISLVRVCSGHWKFVALWHFELPHASHIAQIRSIVSRQFVLLCPVGSTAPLHFVRAFVLTAFEAPSVSEG